MIIETAITDRFDLTVPVIQAPMAGGGDTPALVSVVGEAGGLGFIGGAYLTPGALAEAAKAVRSTTNRPFGINLFAPMPVPDAPADPGPALDRVAPYFAELGLPAPNLPQRPVDRFDELLAVVLESGATIFSVAFGIPAADAIAAVKARGIAFWGTATTVAEAVALERAGAEAIIAQGSEAGGHRGTFLGPFEQGLVGTMTLVPQIADAVSAPVIAAGGIMDGRGIAAALGLGAAAVQMGTAFLTCDEAGVVGAYKDAIVAARDDDTRITRAFSGRPARGIVNRFMSEVEAGGGEAAILPFPWQNDLTRPLRQAAAKAGRSEFLSLWAGQGARAARREPAAALMARLKDELVAVRRAGAPAR